MTMNIIMFFLVFSFLLSLVGLERTMFSELLCQIGVEGNTVCTCVSITVPIINKDMCLTLASSILLLFGAGILLVTGTFIFPNPYLIFAPITLFLLGFLTFPISIFNDAGMPDEVKTFIIGIFSVMYIFAVINAYKGGEV